MTDIEKLLQLAEVIGEATRTDPDTAAAMVSALQHKRSDRDDSEQS